MATYTLIMAIILNLFILKQALFAKHNLIIARAAALLWVVPFLCVAYFDVSEATEVNLVAAFMLSLILTALWMILDMVAMQRMMRARKRDMDKK